MNKRKVPKIRFKGFYDDWEQRKLDDIYSERNERGNAELDILSVSIHHGISQNELDTDELGKSVRRSDDKSLYKHVYYGDLVFNMMRAWQGAIGVVKNEGMVSPAYISAIPDDSVFPEFMDYCLRRKCIINQINNLSYGVTDFRKRLYWEPFTRVTIMMPSVDEQRKITAIFHQLDDLITLHQRKLEKLKIIKKSMLENCFPKNGEKAPKIRFSGFSDDWEQRELGDIASDMVVGGDIDKDLILAEGQYPVIANALIGDGIVGYYDKEYRVNAPAVTVTGRGDVGHAKARLVNFTPVVRLLSVKSEHDVFFLENAINTLKIVIESTGVPQLTVPQLAKYEVAFPRQLDEEEHIGAFFKYLDHLITLHQSKLEKLKMIKKSMLETMFV